MRVLIFSILIIFMSSGCNSDQKEIVQSVSKDTIKTITTDSIAEKKDSTFGKPYFDFDEVVHYKIEITDEEFDLKTNWDDPLNKPLWNILTGFNDKAKMSDYQFWVDLNSIKKKEYKINKKYFNQFNTEIFVEREPCIVQTSGCMPIYRDILIFKKHSKIKGVARICFKCDLHIIEGNVVSAEYFGMNGEYKMLEKIFEENSKQ